MSARYDRNYCDHREHRDHRRTWARNPTTRSVCAWTVGGWTCSYPRASVLVAGQTVPTQFCQHHQCSKVDDGTVCAVATVSGYKYCPNHIRCAALTDGTRCSNFVKGLNAEKFKFCAQMHNCCSDGCVNQRVTDDPERTQRHCAMHVCPVPLCPREKLPAGPACALHTCSHPSCSAQLSNTSLSLGLGLGLGFGFGLGIEPQSSHAARYCDRHRVCGTDGCARLCHTRETGEPSRHCGFHYCRAEGCERERRGEETCGEHTCVEGGCPKMRSDGDGLFCKAHQCKRSGCRFRRRRGDWCAEHMCAKPGCETEESGNGYCGRHQLCVVVGCEKYRAVIGDKVLERCSEHEAAICTYPACDHRTETGRLFCSQHLCTIRECAASVAGPGSALCMMHKCAVPHCTAAKWSMLPLVAAAAATVPLPFAAGVMAGAASPFCVQHACHHPGCAERSEPESQRCREHARCRHEGCGRLVERGGDGRFCLEHMGQRWRGWGDGGVGIGMGRQRDQWANWGVTI